MNTATSAEAEHQSLRNYYKLHAGIYDATRWSFLFGRRRVLELVAGTAPARVLEIGCGTGANLETLCRLFPQAEITGVDLSSSMLDQAWTRLKPHLSRVRLEQMAYSKPVHESGRQFDLVVCSYALSMFNPGWEQAIESAYADLAPGGRMVVVDFHDSPVSWFRRWMGVNHVRMEAHLRPALQQRFKIEVDRPRLAYGGLWRYLMFVGQKPAESLV